MLISIIIIIISRFYFFITSWADFTKHSIMLLLSQGTVQMYQNKKKKTKYCKRFQCAIPIPILNISGNKQKCKE